MAELFASGRVIEGILGLVLLEIVGLTILRNRWKIGIPSPELLVSIGAGVGLLLALRAALVGAAWPNIALWLIVALVAHVWDLGIRFRTTR